MAPERAARAARHRSGRGRRSIDDGDSLSRSSPAPLSRSVRVPAARQFKPGTVRSKDPGTKLRCLVLAPGPDWVAVDLDSGALLRAPVDFSSNDMPGYVKPFVAESESGSEAESGSRSAAGGGTPGGGGPGGGAGLEPGGGAGAGAGPDAHAGASGENGLDPSDDEGFSSRWSIRPLRAVEMTLGPPCDPVDPARPEAVMLAGRPIVLGEPRRRATRRLLRHLITKAPDQPLLGTLGPSISYGDLDGTRPSVVIVSPQVRPRFGIGPAGPWCQFVLGDRRHTMPCAGGVAPDASTTGHESNLLVVALGPPKRGQVPKVVLGALSL